MMTMAKRETITLTRQSVPNGLWLSTLSDPEVRELFGTDTIPTPWFNTTPLAFVVERLRAIPANDNVDIIFDGEIVGS
jgi:hypothetical protein